MRTGRAGFAVLCFLCAASVAAFAQAPTKPAFEAASIKPTAPGTRQSRRVTATRIDFVNTDLRSLLLTAFRLQPYQLSAPQWLNTAMFDIHATYPADVAPRLMPEMLQTLLVERFGLVSHIEPRPVDLYELVVGKNGITMREVEVVDDLDKTFPREAPASITNADVTWETPEGPVRSMFVPFGTRTITARTMYEKTTTDRRTTKIDATRMTMAELATALTSNVDRPVLDKTGLTGVYQFTIELPPDATAVRMLRSIGISSTVQGTPLSEPTGVSVFKAVEGLGLKLEERRVPIPVLVVDRIERSPIEN